MTQTADTSTPAAPPGTPCAAARCHRTMRDHELAAHQVLCSPCVDTIAAWLTEELPRQCRVLRASRQRETTSSRTGGRTVHRTAPLPGRADTLNLLGPAAYGDTITDPYGDSHGDQHGPLSITGTLTPWVRLICEHRRWNPPQVLTEQTLATWLAHPPLLTWAARQPWAGDMRDELAELMRTIRAITRLRPQRRPVTQPCPRCDSLMLVETDHQLYIECTETGCGGLFTRDELALAARIHPDVLAHNAA